MFHDLNMTCVCGHIKNDHERMSTYSGDIDDDLYEFWCVSQDDPDCECDLYTPDNLKHLERLDANNSGL